MNRIKNLASNTPVGFSTFVVLGFIVLIIFSAVLTNRHTPESESWYIAGTAARLVSVGLFVALAAGLGRLNSAGFTRIGRWQAWLAAIIVLGYGVPASSYAMTGRLSMNIPGPALVSAMGIFMMAHALLEEIAFRGLVLPAFLNRWGSTTGGVLKSVVVASLFFASIHFTNVLGGNPFPAVLLQAVGAVFLGIFFGGLVVRGRSIYPAVLLHGLLNIAAQLNLTSGTVDGSAASIWLVQTILMIPLAIYGVYLILAAARALSQMYPPTRSTSTDTHPLTTNNRLPTTDH